MEYTLPQVHTAFGISNHIYIQNALSLHIQLSGETLLIWLLLVAMKHITSTKMATYGKTATYGKDKHSKAPQIARFMGPTWGQPGFRRPSMGPMLVPWTLLSGALTIISGYTRLDIELSVWCTLAITLDVMYILYSRYVLLSSHTEKVSSMVV